MKKNEAHWWGYAALPDGMTVPYHGEENPMTPVCQFPLDEGMVYIFADLDYWFGDIEAESGALGEWDTAFYQVLYSPTRENLHEHKLLYSDGTSAVPPAKPIHKTLPAPADCWQDELAQDYPGYECLLQLDEDDDIGLRFYDCGTLFFLIRPEDLKTRDFRKVKCVLYSY